ncbi:MAG: DUF2384 domain-containing protein [Anaerolineae bacterium]|nr:DUF2384 domain-containing protein [Anaerolineae bacterium]
MSEKKRPKRGQIRRPARPRRRSGGPSLTTVEGDALVEVSAHYRHAALPEIRQILIHADDFGLDDNDEAEADGTLEFPWFETDPDQPGLFAPIGQRVLAQLTLTPDTLEVEAMSQERLQRCDRRLKQLLGERVSPTKPTRRKPRPSKSLPQSSGPFIPPPELVAQLEEQMLRQWIDESIPALGGLTPRQAVKTPEGRRQVLELIEESEQMQGRMKNVPGMFAPDYGKVKQMLNLE